MTHAQKVREERFYSITAWMWNEGTGEYDPITIFRDLTIKEAKAVFPFAKLDVGTPQYDLWFDDDEVREKAAVKELLDDGEHEEWLMDI